MDRQRDPKRPRTAWPEFEPLNGQKMDSPQQVTHVVRHRLDPQLSATIARLHHELIEIRKDIQEIKSTMEDLRDTVTVEYEPESSDEEEEEEESDDDAEAVSQQI